MKGLIKILKNSEETVPKKKVASERFKSLLASRSLAEEKALYSLSKQIRGLELKTDEGTVEHHVADSLLYSIRPPRKTSDVRHWKAQLQVLGELVDHHLKEEEDDLFPVVRKKLSREIRYEQGEAFLKLRQKSQPNFSQENSGALKN